MQPDSQSVDTFLATKESFCNDMSLYVDTYLCHITYKLSHFFLVSCLVRTLQNSGLALSCHHAPTLDSSPFKTAKTSYTCDKNYMLHTAVDRYIKNTGDKLLNSWSWYSCRCALPGRPAWILFQDEANSRWPPKMGTPHPVLSDLDILNNSSYFSSFSQEDVAV